MRATKVVFITCLCMFVFFGTFVIAADVAKIGVIDFQKVLETADAGKTIQSELKKENEKGPKEDTLVTE